MSISRRQALQSLVGVPLLAATLPSPPALRGEGAVTGAPAGTQPPRRRPRIAVVYTVCYHRSHAHVLLENFLTPFLFSGTLTEPAVEVASLYADQRSRDPSAPDLTDDITRIFRVPLYKTIGAALTLGGRDLAVDGVLAIGEHGNYPVNQRGVRKYPRKRFFDEIVATMRRSQRFVPLFNDKHLSYRWDWAKEMYDTCQRHRIPFMAGSSVPLRQRRPPLDLPANCVIDEAISIHGGSFESYDFHAIEVLLALLEARRSGETGVAHVEFLSGDALFQAARRGRWSIDLARAAMRAELGDSVPDITRPIDNVPAHGILLTFRDGTKATVLKLGSSITRWNFASQLRGEPRPRAMSHYVGPWHNRCLFMALAHAIQRFFVTGRAPYPVERTLLATGIVEAAVRSRAAAERLATPHLDIAYPARDFRALCETGASWRILTEQTREPVGFAARPLRGS